jgi:hypothetical protein
MISVLREDVHNLGKYNNEIEQFIYEICYRPIWEKVNTYIYDHPLSLNLSFCHIKYPDSAILEDMMLEFPCSIRIKKDTLFLMLYSFAQ